MPPALSSGTGVAGRPIRSARLSCRPHPRRNHDKSRSFSRGAPGGDSPAAGFGNFSAYGAPHAGSFIRAAARVKPSERHEDAIQVLLVKTDSIVFHSDPAECIRMKTRGLLIHSCRPSESSGCDKLFIME